MSSITSVNQKALEAILPPQKPAQSTLAKRIADIFLRFFKSHTLKAVILTAAILASITTIALTSSIVVIAITGIITGLACLTLGIYLVVNRKKIFYEVSLFATLFIKNFRPNYYPWWHQITPHLYLGALPLKNLKHDVKIEQLNVKAVLSLVENFEFVTRGLMSVPCQTVDWEKLGVKHVKFPAVDFKPVPLKVIEKGVDFLEEHVDQGINCYVHCKAGRSRSAAVVLAYLLKKKIVPNVEEGIQYLKQKRPLVSIQKGKKAILEEYFKKHCMGS